MWYGSASGECLPLMVVYKAKNLYESWVKGKLKGCIYNDTKSGWFDSLFFLSEVTIVVYFHILMLLLL